MSKDKQMPKAPRPLTPEPAETLTVSDADFEQMYRLLYAYRFGSISFLGLLDKLEEILGISSGSNSDQ